MKKTLLICILSLVMVFSLVACDDLFNPPSNDGGNENDTPVHTHNFGEWDITKNPTCTEEGTKVRYCSCGEKQSEVVVASGHTPADATIENKVDATYEADGSYDEVIRCLNCKETLSETSRVIPMLKHTPADAVEENRVEATCYSEGSYDMVVYCSDCDTELERTHHTISKIEHTPATAVEENIIEATCTVDGSYDEVIYCSVENCKLEIRRTTKIITATGHEYINYVCALCSNDLTSKGLAFESSGNNTCYVSGIGTCTDTDIIIPATSPDGYIVVGIGDYAFSHKYNLTSIIIPDSVTTIGAEAFYDCCDLTSVVIGNSVKSIGSNAFYGCSSLTSIVIPDSVTSIGTRAFSYCYVLTELHLGNGIKAIPSYMAYGCESLASVVIPDSVTTIGAEAFYDCKCLASVTVSSGLTNIETNAFAYCDNLVEVINNSNLAIVAGSDTYGKIALNAMEVHKGESNIVNVNGFLFYSYEGENYLVSYCTDKKDVLRLPESYNGDSYIINDYAFCEARPYFTTVVIPSSVKLIKEGAFVHFNSDRYFDIIIYAGVGEITSNALNYSAWYALQNIYVVGSEEDFSKINWSIPDSWNGTIHYNYVPEE